jgi:hypothetical protein
MPPSHYFPKHCSLTHSEFKVVNIIALLSAIALLSLASRVIWLACNPIFGRVRKQVPTAEAAFFRTRMGVFAICLLIGNLFVSIAGVIGVSWLVQGKVVQGRHQNSASDPHRLTHLLQDRCVLSKVSAPIQMILYGADGILPQAVFMAMGNTSTAYFTVAIAVHSFTSLVLRYRHSDWVGLLAILVGLGLALATSLFPLSRGVENGEMYGPGDFTCGVQSIFPKALFYHHLLPVRIIFSCHASGWR